MNSGVSIDQNSFVSAIRCGFTDLLQIVPPLFSDLNGCPAARTMRAYRDKLQFSIFAVDSNDPRVTMQNYKMSWRSSAVCL